MSIAIRDDVASSPPYNRLIERLLSEGRAPLVCRCGHDNCARSLFVFHEPNSAVAALKWHVGFLLERSHPDHDSIYDINEEFPPEVDDLITTHNCRHSFHAGRTAIEKNASRRRAPEA